MRVCLDCSKQCGHFIQGYMGKVFHWFGQEKLVQALHRATKSGAGGLGEVLFLIALGALVFWLYYQMTANGIASLLPAEWRNSVM